MLSKLKRQFFAGLVIFVPLSLTIYFVWLFFLMVSQTLLPLLSHQRWIEIPPNWVRPISFLLTMMLIWSLGVAVSNFVGRKLVDGLEGLIRYLPFFRGLYEAIQKMTEAFFGTNPIYQSVVLVEYPRSGTYAFGFVTSRLSGKALQKDDPHLCVFIPTVPNPTSGILLYVREAETIPLTISIEEAAKILVSHGFVPISEDLVKGKISKT